MNYKPDKKLKLEKIKIKSFTTNLGDTEKVLGGSPQLGPLMLHNNANISRYGIVFTSNEVFTGRVKLGAIRSNG